MTEKEIVETCEKGIQEVLKKYNCILETHTILVNGIMAEQRIVAVIKKENRIKLVGSGV